MMSIVPQDCDIVDTESPDARRVMQMHVALYGRAIEGMEEFGTELKDFDGN